LLFDQGAEKRCALRVLIKAMKGENHATGTTEIAEVLGWWRRNAQDIASVRRVCRSLVVG
jgi:Uma2 family endonuclease